MTKTERAIFWSPDPKMCLLHPKTGASGSPVFPGHVRDPLWRFSCRARKELRFEGC